MFANKIKVRPFHIWLIGVMFFAPALLVWIVFIILFSVKGMFDCPFDEHGVRHIYLPFLAAVLGFCIPVICLRVLRQTSARVWVPIFIAYCVIMLMWGIIDIRCENYQVGGHRYPNGPLVDGHRYYFHQYYTWYFLPYRLIEKGIGDQQTIEIDLKKYVSENQNDSYIKYMWDNPPSCVASLSCKADSQLKKALLGDYGDYTTVFGLKCPCGGAEFYVKGKDIQTGYEGVAAPISVICKSCGRNVKVFDPTKHGADGEFGFGFSHDEYSDKSVKCPKCEADVFRVALAFQYSGDEKQIIEEDGLDKKPQDLFSWLSGQACCQSCGYTFKFANIECQ